MMRLTPKIRCNAVIGKDTKSLHRTWHFSEENIHESNAREWKRAKHFSKLAPERRFPPVWTTKAFATTPSLLKKG